MGTRLGAGEVLLRTLQAHGQRSVHVKPIIYWFRSDLRLDDNAAWQAALRHGPCVLPVYVHDPQLRIPTRWGVERMGRHRHHFLRERLVELRRRLSQSGFELLECEGAAAEVLPELLIRHGAAGVVCEEIAVPYEQGDVAAIRRAGVDVHTVWQSSLFAPEDLPFCIADLPDSFTAFRKRLECEALRPRPVLATRASPDDACDESTARAHVRRYLESGFARTYKQTRDALYGHRTSSLWSRWLGVGALSPREIYRDLKAHEAAHGANDGTYWLWFELLWRDYFRFLHLKFGRRLYRGRGLSVAPTGTHNAEGFARWCAGETGEPLVDAGMRELASTGFLSNRMRQIAASYLIYELNADYRAGAAWFEYQLVDYDPYSNQGNWLYIAGRGTDPRGGRRFDVAWQTAQHDPDGVYRRMWS